MSKKLKRKDDGDWEPWMYIPMREVRDFTRGTNRNTREAFKDLEKAGLLQVNGIDRQGTIKVRLRKIPPGAEVAMVDLDEVQSLRAAEEFDALVKGSVKFTMPPTERSN